LKVGEGKRDFCIDINLYLKYDVTMLKVWINSMIMPVFGIREDRSLPKGLAHWHFLLEQDTLYVKQINCEIEFKE